MLWQAMYVLTSKYTRRQCLFALAIHLRAPKLRVELPAKVLQAAALSPWARGPVGPWARGPVGLWARGP